MLVLASLGIFQLMVPPDSKRTASKSQPDHSVSTNPSWGLSIVESAKDAIITIDSRQRIVVFNPAAEEMFCCSSVNVIGQSIDQFIPSRFRATHEEHVSSFAQTGVTARSMGGARAVYGLRSNGEEFPIEASISQIEVDGDKLFTVIMRDITERQRIQNEMRQQADLLDLAPMFARNLDDRITLWTSGAQRLYGFTQEEALGRVSHELLNTKFPEPLAVIKEKVLRDGKWEGELIHTGRDGRDITSASQWALHSDRQGTPVAILQVSTDISERKHIESQLLRAQRMESIGTLAGGIAHDLNNILSPMMMAVEILKLEVTSSRGQEFLELLKTNAERGANMIRQVLSFARGLEGERLVIQTAHIIKELTKVLRETLPKSIEVRFAVPASLWPVSADPTQIHQLLMNLCVNARDAMPHGGSLLIRAENCVIDDNYARMNVEARTGEFVKLSVVDTGSGLDPAITGRIFEPFFTTKGVGKGTGLGLSTVATIVKSHGGFINVYSEPGNGTEMTVYLPACKDMIEQPVRSDVRELPVGHGELVLVVDDEEAIRQITKSTLETFGYRVLLAGDGTEAIALYAEHKNSIRIVLTDMMMPFMDGVATIRALRKMSPDIKIISASGLADSAKTAEAVRAGVQSFLPKPYTAEQLLKRLAEVLQNR